jgi:mRNA interferase MazF
MRRGEIRLVDLGEPVGSEAGRQRPAVLVSNDGANATAARLGRGVVTVVPITSNLRQVLRFQTELPAASTGLGRDSKAQAEQVRSIDAGRVGRPIGHVPPGLMVEVEAALRLHLAL